MFRRRETSHGQLADDIVSLLRQYQSHAQHIGHAFAGQNQLGAADLHALLAVMEAERAGAPLTAGRLAEELNFSTSSVTALVDRLETTGHIYRQRDTDDRRKVYLRYADAGAEVAMRFFAPLGRRSDAVMDRFSDSELSTVKRFLEEMTQAMREHRDDVRGKV
ncbi:MarR family winged helix-turn-helix transcriptional regulator [Catelliglobosispora koreensis]|uniref:MarR family winged helix-turn-helix transcriptional regulator n=1 Tax=Catelliglobosispora koreensis TaxID=129052 RepID=UPI0004766172|nr:MarR family transcriptional regulator [Catelliglobosispora koreensis]